jgi:sulfotransferase family protein
MEPFESGDKRVLVHCARHRVGTVWFRRVLGAVSERYGLTMQVRKNRAIEPGVDVIYNFKASLPLDGIGPFRASHIVRDPRDIAVSGYHYHLWTKERWVHIPREEYGGKTYQEYLKSVAAEAGLAAEITRLAGGMFKGMAAWDYRRPEFLELRYEDVIADEHGWFTKLFRHYGFTDTAVEESVEIAGGFSFSKVTGRKIGEAATGSHLRSGRHGQWREDFSPANVALFKRLTGDLVVRLGYETDEDW